MSRVLDRGSFSERPFQLHVRAVDVRLIHVVLWCICLTRYLSCSELMTLVERKLVFNVDGLRRLAAQSVDQSPADKYYAVASEVATMDFLRSSGLPTLNVYGYLSEPDKAAGTEYIFMEFVQGIKLNDI